MRDVAVFDLWKIGRTVFTAWFAALSLVAVFLFLRISTRLSFRESIVANMAISGLSTLFVAFVPMPLYAYAVGRELLCPDCSQSITWIIPIGLSGLLGALLGYLVLRVAKEKVTSSAFSILVALNLTCVGIAVWRMVVYVIANPPEA